MKLTSFRLAFWLLAISSIAFCGAANADSPVIPGRTVMTADPVAPAVWLAIHQDDPMPRAVYTNEVQITQEIQSLARALDNDPRQIYEYVFNNVEYIPLYGARNGATATLLSKRGNDLDQCALLIALLKAANPESDAHYVEGVVEYEKTFLGNMLGINSDQVLSLLGNCLIPADSDGYYYIQMLRYWVETTINGTNYVLDSAFKEYDTTSALDLLSIAGYSRTQFLARATIGATVTANSIRNANEINVRADLASYASNLVGYVRTNYPNADPKAVMGGRKIRQQVVSSLPTSLPYAAYVLDETVTAYAALPSSLFWSLTVQHQGIDKTMYLHEFAGKRISIFYTGTGKAPQLRVDGTLIATGSATTTGLPYNVTIMLSCPNADAVSNTFSLKSGKYYVIANDFGAACPALIAKVSEMLARDRASGLAETSEAVLGGSLHLMSLSYFNQLAMQQSMVGQMTRTLAQECYDIGLMAQEDGYYIDIPMAALSMKRYDGDDAKENAFMRSTSLLASALEHGMLEQMQGTNRPGVSTMKLLEISNATNRETFFANSANWSGASGVRTKLVNYSAQDLATLDTYMASNVTAILPKDAAIVLAQWTGEGYIVYNNQFIGLLIDGNYKGGYSAYQGNVQSVVAQNQTATAYMQLPTENIARPQSQEPVDLASGDYLFENMDLSMGGEEPRGMRFVRYYNSAQSTKDSRLRHGWTHNYDIRASVHSNPDLALGGRQATDAAGLAVYGLVAADLLENDLSARGWVTASLASKWAMDQLTENAVNVQLGNKSLVYVKLPDGTYNSPPGVTAELISNSQIQFGWSSALPAPADYDGDGTADLTVVHGGTNWYIEGFSPFPFGFGYPGGLMVPADYDGDGTDDLASIDPATWNWRIRYSSSSTTTNFQFGFAGCVPVPGDYNGNGLTELAVVSTNNFNWYISGHTPFPHQFGFAGCLPVPGDYNGNGLTELAVVNTNTFNWYIAGHSPYPQQFGWAGCIPVPDDYDGDGHTDIAIFAPSKATLYVHGSLKGFWSVPLGQSGGMVVHGDFDGDGRAQVATYQPTGGLWCIQGTHDGLFHLQERFGVEYVFNRDRNIALWEDADHNALSFGYDAQTNLSSVSDWHGRTLNFTYSGATQLTAVADSSGRSVSYGYGAGNLTSYVDPEGKAWTYTYDSNRWMRSLSDPLPQTTATNTYDALGMVVTQKNAAGNSWSFFVVPKWRSVEQDPFGGRTTYYFDGEGRQIAVEDALGNLRRVEYDGQGHVTNEIDPRGFQTRYQYDANHNRTNVVDARTNATAFAYDSQHRLVSVRDALGRVTQYGYDDEHHVTNVVDALTNRTASTYRADGLPQTMTGPRGETASYTYDNVGNPTAIVRTDGGTEKRTWNALGDLLALTDANTNTTTYTYDKRRLLTSERDPYQQRITNLYNAAGLLVIHVDKRNGATVTTYTPTYKVAGIRHPDGGIVSNFYDAADRLVRVRDPLGFIATNQYDLAGRLIRVVDPLGNAVSNAYDAAGNVVAVKDQAGNMSSNQYDSLNRLVRSIDPLGHVVSNGYDAIGRLVAQVDQTGILTEYEYDALGRVTLERRAGLEHVFEYDASGNRTTYVNPKEERMGFGYDRMNRLVAETNAIGQVTRMGYDAAGNLRQKINANGQTNIFAYNALNQLTNRMSGTENVSFRYDPNGNLTNMVDSLGTTRQSFDAMNRLVQVVDAFGQTVSNQYDLAGQRTRIVYPDGKVQTFAYDGASRLTNANAAAFGLSAVSYGYDSRNDLTWANLPGGLVASNAYDAMSRRLAWSVSKAGSNLLARSCARNPLGFRTNETIAAGLDAIAGPAAQTRTHDAADRITDLTQSGPGMTNTPYFDAAGNVTQMVVTAGGQTYAARYGYDFNNRLTAVTRLRSAPDGAAATTSVVQLEYDGQGLLLRITEDGNVRRLVRDRADQLARPLVEMGATTNAVRWFAWANGKLLAQVESNGAIRVAHSDELGKILALTDENGALSDEYAYQPYGRLIAHSGTNDLPFAFMGDYGVWNAGNGLYLTRHRAYDANLMRFLQPDPIGIEGGRNLYSYADGNPLFWLDPLGLTYYSNYISDGIQQYGYTGSTFVQFDTSGQALGQAAVQGFIASVGIFNLAGTASAVVGGTLLAVEAGPAVWAAGSGLMYQIGASQPLQGLVNTTSLQGGQFVTEVHPTMVTFGEMVAAMEPYAGQFVSGVIPGPGGPYRNWLEFSSWLGGTLASGGDQASQASSCK